MTRPSIIGPLRSYRPIARLLSGVGGASIGLVILLLVAGLALGLRPGKLSIIGTDAPQYLNAAYHLRHSASFTQDPGEAAAPPAIGREPGYALLLAGLLLVDPTFSHYTPACGAPESACDAGLYRDVGLINLAMILGAGVALFALARRLTGRPWCGLVAAAYMLLNFQMNKGWVDPVSDRLAVLLVSLCLLAIALAWGTRNVGRWALVGLALAALTLTKAVFLYAVVPGLGIAGFVGLLRPPDRPRILLGVGMIAIVYALIVGGWMERNRQVAGAFRLTDARGGIALSTRAVFNDMSPTQYAAAFVYWLRGPGPGLARRLFASEIVDAFDLDQPGGFYDRGQNGYPDKVARIMASRDLDWLAATAVVDREIRAAILAHPLTHLATTLPLFYRGIWVDEFIVLGLPLFFWMATRALRRGDFLILTLLSFGAFNLIFYALISLNIPRYQMTAVPSLALAAALAVASLFPPDRGAAEPSP